MLQVPRLNFGSAPVAQLPTGMGQTGNAIMAAMQMKNQRQKEQEALARQQEQQNFSNNIATQNMGINQANADIRQRGDVRAQQAHTVNMDQAAVTMAEAKKTRDMKDRQKVLLSSFAKTMEGKSDAEKYTGFSNLVTENPNDFDINAVGQMYKSNMEDLAEAEAADQKQSNLDRDYKLRAAQIGSAMRLDAQRSKLAIAKYNQTIKAGGDPAASAGHLKDASTSQEKMYTKLQSRSDTLNATINGYKKILANAIKDRNIALVQQIQDPKMMQLLGDNQGKDFEQISKLIQSNFIAPLEDEANEAKTATNKALSNWQRTQGAYMQSMGQASGQQPVQPLSWTEKAEVVGKQLSGLLEQDARNKHIQQYRQLIVNKSGGSGGGALNADRNAQAVRNVPRQVSQDNAVYGPPVPQQDPRSMSLTSIGSELVGGIAGPVYNTAKGVVNSGIKTIGDATVSVGKWTDRMNKNHRSLALIDEVLGNRLFGTNIDTGLLD